MKTKIFVITLLVCAFVGTFALVACTPDKPVDPVPHTHTFSPSWEYNSTEHWHVATCEHTTERDSVAPHQLDKDGKCTVCNYVAPKMSFDELVTSHKTKLCEFVETNIVAKVLGEKDVLSKSVFVSSNSNDDLGGVDVLYTYSDGETKRVVEYVQVSVDDGVTPQAIADGTATAYKVSENTTKVFEFDAKENYLKQALANSLFKATGFEDQATKLFAEIPSQYDNTRLFSIFIQDGSKLQLKNIEVLKGNDNDETVIENLTNPNRFTVTDDVFITLKGTNIFCNDYILEQFEQDKEDVQISDKQLLEAIEQNCKDNMLNKLPLKSVIEEMFGSFDKNNISNENWYINQENDQIKALTYAFFYRATYTSGYYIITSMNFSTPVSREDFVAGNLPSATYKQEYSISYNPSIQEDRSALANAILTACKCAPADNGSTVILVDNRTTTNAQFGIVGRFTVVEINESGATEYHVQIKYAETDEQYIQEVANGNYTQTQTAVEYHITGDKLTSEE